MVRRDVPGARGRQEAAALPRLAALVDLLRRSPGERELLDRLLAATTEHAGAERAMVLMRSGAVGSLTVSAARNVRDQPALVAASADLCRRALAQRAAVVAEPRVAGSLAFPAAAAMPLLARGQAFGVLYFEAPAGAPGVDQASLPFFEVALAVVADALACTDARDSASRARVRSIELARHFARGPRLLTGPSEASGALTKAIEQAAARDQPVLVIGPPGSGKELVARAVHAGSSRREGPFVLVPPGAGPAGGGSPPELALAAGGTLFLDGFERVCIDTQMALMAALEPQPPGGASPVRLMASMTAEPDALVRDGLMRHDFCVRLQVFPVYVTPLRERPEDVVPLARQLLAEAAAAFGRPVRELAPDAEGALEAHPWPFDVRELRAVVELAVLRARGDKVLAADLPLPARP